MHSFYNGLPTCIMHASVKHRYTLGLECLLTSALRGHGYPVHASVT